MKKILFSIVLFALFVSAILLRPVKIPQLDSNILVIEGWLPPVYLEQIACKLDSLEHKQIWVTGVSYPSESGDVTWFINRNKLEPFETSKNVCAALYGNGSIALIPLSQQIVSDTVAVHFTASGTTALSYNAHLSLAINNEYRNSLFLTETDSIYSFYFALEGDTLHSITISFSNDASCNRNEDRNMNIQDLVCYTSTNDSIKMDAYKISAAEFPNCPNNFISEAHNSYVYMLDLECKTGMLPVMAEYVNRNKTYASMKALWNYYEKVNLGAKKINIITSRSHAQRTYLNARHFFGNKVGIIPIELEKQHNCKTVTWHDKLRYFLDEKFSIVATRVDLWNKRKQRS
jgi:hypothetical protein